ncbi:MULTISPECIES: DUF4259 domain-containing protein [Corallococcus]|uniref:DUF4259 domain-containing protein n=1 Tax=Corallococcus TaxID=83461 RepID=UPI000EE68540|nr:MULTISPECIES: DUF4259 domain-containing protein [Corallococcus]NPC72040.1 DUF4259 domain-containing protein [Corallococcus exiguus]NPD22359.1 DUF4259 domain-containing protein [Corallococcus exiguus]RKI01215.1 DUF4259 domain-containing protein [Corallococcus sp. AB038B]
MGTWGFGNFENDTAGEHLVGVVRPLLQQIADTVRDEALMAPDEYDGVAMISNLEIIACLAESLGKSSESKTAPGMELPPPATIEKWREDYLRVWDGYIDQLNPKPDFKRRRRKVIQTTFERVLAAAQREHAR